MNTDVEPISVDLYFIPVKTRVPLKFGTQVVTSVTCARVCVTVANKQGQYAHGWGETPLSAEWAWPSLWSSMSGLRPKIPYAILFRTWLPTNSF